MKKKRRFWISIFIVVIFIIILAVLLYFLIRGNTQSWSWNTFVNKTQVWMKQDPKKPDKTKTLKSLSLTTSATNNKVEIDGTAVFLNNSKVYFEVDTLSSNFNTLYYDYLENPMGDGSVSWYTPGHWQNPGTSKAKYIPAVYNMPDKKGAPYQYLVYNGLRSSGIDDLTYSPAWVGIVVQVVIIVIIVAALVFVTIWMSKRSAGGMNPFGGNRARMQKSKVRFSDVAGIKEEKQEVYELIDYLKRPQKYTQMGAHAPKGVILIGPPGTGKTLLAKAVAGEAGVPFFWISGSEFEEVFVGVGASRVRDMFSAAKKNAPCIIFIDEIDAVGQKRSQNIGGNAGDQTLNQLLVELDGFETNSGVLVIAATNNAEVLDQALVRPGRFDRQIQVSLPDLKERAAILKLHARNKNIDSKVSFDLLALRTPGFSGAQLENLLNEAAILAVRRSSRQISLKDLDEAADRVVAGPAKLSRGMNEKDRQIVSYHEAGHAVIGLKVSDASKVQKITIIPRGQAGGYTLITPKEESFFYTKEALYAMITGFLGGRASEEILFNDDRITTGAHDDFEKATSIARRMVTEYGMSELGLIQLENERTRSAKFAFSAPRYSEELTRKIDEQIRKILEQCHRTAQRILKENWKTVELIAKSLRIMETINADMIDEINRTQALPKEVLEQEAKLKHEANLWKEGKVFEVEPENTQTISESNKEDDITKPSHGDIELMTDNTSDNDKSIVVEPDKTTNSKPSDKKTSKSDKNKSKDKENEK